MILEVGLCSSCRHRTAGDPSVGIFEDCALEDRMLEEIPEEKLDCLGQKGNECPMWEPVELEFCSIKTHWQWFYKEDGFCIKCQEEAARGYEDGE